MNALVTLAFVLLLSLSPSSRATVSFYTLKDAYDMNSGNPQVYRYDEVSNFRSGTQASITTRIMSTGFSSDIAIDEQGRFYLVSGLPTDTSTKQIWYWNSLADWAANTNGGLLGQRNTTFQVSGFSMYKNELYFLDGSPNGFGNKTLRKWASATPWANRAPVLVLKSMPAGPCGFSRTQTRPPPVAHSIAGAASMIF